MSEDPRTRYHLEAAACGQLILAPDPADLERLDGVEFLDHRAAVLVELVGKFTAEGQPITAAALADRALFPFPWAYVADCMQAKTPAVDAVAELLADRVVDLEGSPDLFRFAEYADTEPLNLPEHVVPGLPCAAVSFLHGAEGAGKTALALQLAIAKASGTSWLGQPTGSPAPVLMVAQETGPAELQARIHAVAEVEGLDVHALRARLGVVTEAELGGAYLQAARDLPRLAASVHELRARLVVVDHLSALSPDERDTGQHEIVEQLRRLAVSTGAAVLVLDHDNKGGLGERGAHAGRALKRRAAALTLWLGMERGAPFLEVGKARFLAADERGRVWLRWRSLPDPWGREAGGRPVTWGYLERAEAPGAGNNGHQNGGAPTGRLVDLERLVPCEWMGSGELVALVSSAGLYAGLDGDTTARTVRRDLSRLASSGRLERVAGRGREPARWRRLEG